MVRAFADRLPIDDILPELDAALSQQPNLVLVAPPGAGKTTRVPLALLEAPWRCDGKLILLEPRRLAARAAAQRLALRPGPPKIRLSKDTHKTTWKTACIETMTRSHSWL